MEITLSNMTLQAYWVMLVRLIAAVVFGGLIGIERANSKHDAGLRTHIIVCLGASSVMIVSQLIASRYGAITDVTRLGAQVISGIGFLGVGSIIVTRNRIRGLTTAAGLWTTGCLGLVIGAGFLEIAATIVALMMFTIYVLKPISLKIHSAESSFEITVSLAVREAKEYTEEFSKNGFVIDSIKASGEKAIIVVHTDMHRNKNELIKLFMSIKGVTGVSDA